MLRGSSGFYTYAIFEHLDEWPAFNIDNIRMAFKLNKDKYIKLLPHSFVIRLRLCLKLRCYKTINIHSIAAVGWNY